MLYRATFLLEPLDLLWDPQAMLATDERMENVETRFRTRLLAECIEIIRHYG